MTAPWMNWIKALQAISKTGLHFSEDDYHRERFRQIGDIAADMLAQHTNLTGEEILNLDPSEFGYVTPKVDVRGVAFREGKILLVREISDGCWTLPGGWADVNETPSEAVTREVFEESGFKTRTVKLLAALDRDKQGHTPPHPYHVYKLFYLCEIVGGKPTPNKEADQIEFFEQNNLPPLSVARVLESQIHRFFHHLHNPDLPTDFD